MPKRYPEIDRTTKTHAETLAELRRRIDELTAESVRELANLVAEKLEADRLHPRVGQNVIAATLGHCARNRIAHSLYDGCDCRDWHPIREAAWLNNPRGETAETHGKNGRPELPAVDPRQMRLPGSAGVRAATFGRKK